MFKPAPAHTFRVSYNQAYRAPSLTNSFLDVTILNQMDLGALSPALAGRIYTFPTLAQGNVALTEQSLKAYEIGYSGVIRNRVSVSAAWYYNDMKNEINFTQDAGYSSKNVPPGWPLPPSYLDLIIASGKFGTLGLPAHYTYLNFAKIKYQGLELGFDAAATRHIQIFANYSYQPDPKPSEGIPMSEVNISPHNRFNTGINFSSGRYYGDVSIAYQSKAYWQDVLDARYAGWTEGFTLLNGSFGVKFMGGKLITSVKGTNLANQEVMQHIFGDVMKRSVVGEVKIGLF
jgi:outer membrane receptor protein involved in Fe transport